MRRTTRLFSASFLALTVLVGGSTAASADEIDSAPVVADQEYLAPGEWQVDPSESTSSSTAGSYPKLFSGDFDRMHITKGDVSIHGWWIQGSSTAKTADLAMTLEAYVDGKWRQYATGGKKKVYAGGGSANRANVRFTCRGTKATKWRATLDVDLNWVADSPGVWESKEFTMNCSVRL